MVPWSEIRFEYGHLWWLVLVPVAALGMLHAWNFAFRRGVLRSFSGQSLVWKMVERRSLWRRGTAAVLMLLGLELMVIAGLRPRYGLKEVTVSGRGIDVAVVLDASKSMKATDIAPDRLTAATIEIGRILDAMPTNRVALVPFAGLAFIQTPLTLDHEVVKEYMASLKVTDIPVPGTAIGRALRVAAEALGVDRVVPGGSTRKVILLFTDGENHEGEPEKVAEELASKGVKVYTIGVGTPSGQPVPVLNADGEVVGVAREKDGVTPVLSKLNEDLLRNIASKTGGKYFALTSLGSVAADLVKEIESIEKAEYRARVERLLEDRFQYPLAAGIALVVIAFLCLGGSIRGAIVAIVLFLAFPVRAQGLFEIAHGKVKEATELLQAGKAEEAAKMLEEVLTEMPERPDLLYNLALAKGASGQFDEAVKLLDKALGKMGGWKYGPSRARVLHAKGTFLMQQAKKMGEEKKPAREVRAVWRQAVEALAEAAILEPEAQDTLRNLEIAVMAAYPACSKMDDAQEPNDSAGEAKFLMPNPQDLSIHEELVLCPDNEDWFRLPLRQGETLVLRAVEKDDGERAARVEMRLLDRGEREIAPPGVQVFYKAAEQTDVLLKVTGPKDEDGILYVLDGRLVPACPTGDDAFEDNDTKETRRKIEDGEYFLRACPWDEDWFEYVEKQGTKKDIVLLVQKGEGPLTLEVQHADGAAVDVQKSETEGGTMFRASLPKAEQEAPFYVRVFGGKNEGFYVLKIEDSRGGQEQQQQSKQEQKGGQSIREQLEAIDRNEENLEAREALSRFPVREYQPEKDW